MSGELQLEALGFTPALAATFAALGASLETAIEPARVIRQDGILRVRTATADVLANPSGKLASTTHANEELPVVGDWVAVTPGGPEDQRHILAVAPRSSVLLRRMVGEALKAQAMAANVDHVLVVVALDTPLNIRRLERSLTWVASSGARATVVLNKSDTCEDLRSLREQMAPVVGSTQVLACSARTGEGLQALAELLVPQQTAMLLGPSGAGKSSLVNALLGREEAQRTFSVRAGDSKGRHTTTHRELRILPSGALLVDMPGVRELGLWNEGEGLEGAFEELTTLAAACRFSNCEHESEPGCAVQAALQESAVSPERLESYQKLRRELEKLTAQREARKDKERTAQRSKRPRR